jgi:HAD superfamily hydrolase (TIGR01509 family)
VNRSRASSGGIPRLVIFDCDGTLVDSEVIANEVLQAVAAEEGLHVELDDLMSHFRGRRMADGIAELELAMGRKVSSEFVQNVRDRERDALSLRLQPMKGAKELLRSLNVNICVASSAPTEKIINSLAATRLLTYFEGHIFSSYDIGSWKPEPEIFLHAARSMGCEPCDCVVIEDSVLGIQAALAAGMRVYALQPNGSGTRSTEDVKMISQLSDLLEHAHFRSFVGYT